MMRAIQVLNWWGQHSAHEQDPGCQQVITKQADEHPPIRMSEKALQIITFFAAPTYMSMSLVQLGRTRAHFGSQSCWPQTGPRVPEAPTPHQNAQQSGRVSPTQLDWGVRARARAQHFRTSPPTLSKVRTCWVRVRARNPSSCVGFALLWVLLGVMPRELDSRPVLGHHDGGTKVNTGPARVAF
jgi:hypothetical protein